MAGDPQFRVELASQPGVELDLLEFELVEEVSRPYSLEVTLAPPKGTELDPGSLIGEQATLEVQLEAGAVRQVNGVVAHVATWEEAAGAERRRLRLHVVPALWLMGLVQRCRIFQEKSVPEIAETLLKEGGVALRSALAGRYPPREYCVQYNESDLAFLQRLLEEEGIHYAFEHDQGKHTLVLGDDPSSRGRLDDPTPFREAGGMAVEVDHVFSFRPGRELRPDAVTLRDYDYLHPELDLTARAGKGTLEVYDYPGRYLDGGTGGARARVRLEELRTRARLATGSGTARLFAAGSVFSLEDHPEAGDHYLLSVRHRGFQPALPGAAAEPGRREYENEFTCIPASAPFRPERRTPRPVVAGPQTAVVTGPPGEEVHTDAHGRVKVRFHWDRTGSGDEWSSCWVRVAHPWAGPGWGALFLPRIGHEVVVEFLEGDPDRPVIAGSLYNGMNPPPLSLPADKTQSTLRSASSPGAQGANELRFEDAAGSEQVYLHAQRDLEVVVERDKAQRVGGNEALAVAGDRSREITGKQELSVGGDDRTKVSGSQALEVTGNRTTAVQGDHAESVGGDQRSRVRGQRTATVGKSASESVALSRTLEVGEGLKVSVKGDVSEVVGGARAEEVGGDRRESVGGERREVVSGARTLRVGGNLAEGVGGTRSLRAGQDLVVNAGGKLELQAGSSATVKGSEVTLVAADQLDIVVGSAKISLKKNGDVTIQGAKIKLTASGDLVVKGSKISEN